MDVAARLRRRWRTGPKGPIKLTASLAARIAGLDAVGASLLRIAARTGVSTATVRGALGRVTPRDQVPVEPDVDVEEPNDDAECGAEDGELVVLAPPEPRTTERVAARFGDLLEAPVVITEGAQLPLAGLLLALPALEMTGLLPVAGLHGHGHEHRAARRPRAPRVALGGHPGRALGAARGHRQRRSVPCLAAAACVHGQVRAVDGGWLAR